MTRELLPAGRRELTRAHITFYRAVMEGVDVSRAWGLYLSVDGDYSEALARATIQWVRQALIQEALAAGQPGLIGLFRREPWRVKTNSKPTLAEFSSRFVDAGDWSEAELLEMWREEYGGSDRAEARRQRLSQRLREALQLIEGATRRQPKRSDSVATWLAPSLASKLLEAGLDTLGAVRDSLEARKSARWEEVPGVGEVRADRLVAWLSEYGISPAPSPALPSPTPSSQLAPLERFDLPFHPVLPASQHLPAHSQRPSPYPGNNALGARDDKHAIELWLAAKATNPNTLRSYRKNAERLLLWCYLERRVTFPEMTVEDCIHYRTWLTDLGRKTPEEWAAAGWRLPAEQWFGPRAAKRHSEAWRPFEGPLSPDSVVQDLLTVRSLFEFLLRGHILSLNPWDLMGKRLVTRAKLKTATEQFTSRSFTMEQWRQVIDGLDPEGPELERRLLLVLWLGFACGLRAAEMLSLTLGSLVPGRESWRLRVLGKGDKARSVPLPSPARLVLLSYLDSVGVPYDQVVAAALGPEDSPAAQQPILRGRRGRRRADGTILPTEPLHYTRLYNVLKGHLGARADALAKRDPVAAAKFREASTHWLRHTCATLALKNGVALTGVQRLLGHSELSTTSTYVTELDEVLQAEMESFALRGAG
jgi:site-specific recombinase XerD